MGNNIWTQISKETMPSGGSLILVNSMKDGQHRSKQRLQTTKPIGYIGSSKTLTMKCLIILKIHISQKLFKDKLVHAMQLLLCLLQHPTLISSTIFSLLKRKILQASKLYSSTLEENHG